MGQEIGDVGYSAADWSVAAEAKMKTEGEGCTCGVGDKERSMIQSANHEISKADDILYKERPRRQNGRYLPKASYCSFGSLF